MNQTRIMAATLVGLSGFVARAETLDEIDLLVEALLQPAWDAVFSAGAGGGYKDNVFLSSTDPEGRPFAQVSGEATVMHGSPLGETPFTFYASGEARNYFADTGSNQEYTFFSLARGEQRFSHMLLGTLAAQYFYQDQILDVSITETNREATRVLGHTLTLQPGVRQALPSSCWLTLELPGTRQWFAAPLDDYWEAGPKLTFGHDFGRRSEVTLRYEPSWRLHDSDPARTTTGDAIPGTTRRAMRHDVRAAWRHHWDEKRHWRTLLSGGVRVNDENGEGYSDYTRWAAGAKVQYRAGGWDASVEGRFAHYGFAHQTASATDLSLRQRTDWTLNAQVERRLSRSLFVVAAYEHEAAVSNDPLENYTVNTASAGLRWEF